MQPISPYQVLNVHPECNYDELKTQFKILAKKYHPDKGGDKYIFNLLVDSFKSILHDMKLKNTDKDFHALKSEFTKDSKTKTEYVTANEDFHQRFNQFFTENRTKDETVEKGYDKFINEHDVKTSNKHYKIQKYKEPVGNILSKLDFYELGTNVKDYSGRNDDMRKLQYMDYQYAHTTSKLIDPNQVQQRTDFKSLDDIKQKRGAENFEMTNDDKLFYEKVDKLKNRREQKRIENLTKFDNYLENHAKNLASLHIC